MSGDSNILFRLTNAKYGGIVSTEVMAFRCLDGGFIDIYYGSSDVSRTSTNPIPEVMWGINLAFPC